MIEAFRYAFEDGYTRPFIEGPGAIIIHAERYVDSLQDAKNVPAVPMLDQIVQEGEKLSGAAIFHRLEGLPELTTAITNLATCAQAIRETDERAREKSDILGNEPGYGQSIGSLYQALREHILKTHERELVLAKVLGGLLMRTQPRQLVTIDYLAEEVRRLNIFFPELTMEE